MNLHDIKPGPLFTNATQELPELLGHILTRIQFVPNIRYTLGWRGLAPSTRFQHTWTARIAGLAGIFGVYLDEVETKEEDWAQATYRISYFPGSDERVLRRFSQVARASAARPDYWGVIREFTADIDLAAMFEVGRFTLATQPSGEALVLGLSGLTRRRVTVEDDYPLADGEELPVDHGVVDENLPAFALAYQLFKVLAASVTFVAGEAPSYLTRNTYAGWQYSRTTNGRWHEHPSKSLNFNELLLGFGNTGNAAPTFGASTDMKLKRSETWCAPASLPVMYANALWWHAHDLETLSVVDKRSLGVEDRPQLFVLSGFLGAGKTSFLKHFLEYQLQHRRFVAVIQNEVGEVNLDSKLLDEAYAITELSDGTICCSLAGELRPAVQDLLNNFHPDVIVIETSGATNPLGMQKEIRTLEDLVRFDSLTTIIDSEQFEHSRCDYEVVSDQVRAADVIVLNKTDLVTADQITTMEKTLRQLNPFAAMVHSRHGAVNPGLIYDFALGAGAEERQPNVDGLDCHPHSHDTLTSGKVDFTTHIQVEQLIDVLEQVPPNIFRIKGIVDLVDRGATLVQFVGGRFNLSAFQNPSVTDRFLVLIGHELDPVADAIRSLETAEARSQGSETTVDVILHGAPS